jgi:hypothetical protein
MMALAMGILLLFSIAAQAQKVVRYDLHIRDTTVNYAGKSRMAIAVNGQIPMPTLTLQKVTLQRSMYTMRCTTKPPCIGTA